MIEKLIENVEKLTTTLDNFIDRFEHLEIERITKMEVEINRLRSKEGEDWAYRMCVIVTAIISIIAICRTL